MAWATALALAASGCARETWNAEQWAAAHPELSGRSIGRLGDATPYVLAGDGELVFFFCRWSLDAPLRVSLPPDANSYERDLFQKGLRAWEAAVSGLHFEVVDGAAQVRLRFRDTGPEGARTAVDCEVTPPFTGEGPLHARLVSAQIDLRREERDAWGKPVELGVNQLLGSATHELGHALGLQGHAQTGKSIMVRETFSIEKVAERLNDEKKPKPLQEPAMQALYSLPSGTVIERRPLAAGATRAVDEIARRAQEQGAARALVRVGDRTAAVRWGSGPNLVYYLRNPVDLLARTREMDPSIG